ncbi:P-loop containing nucleoside triphosphate hydrolase protein [Melampsora americana]|nr:P-loop containing nucleoside triphosphate hydrolase protein [Melampsora americana]
MKIETHSNQQNPILYHHPHHHSSIKNIKNISIISPISPITPRNTFDQQHPQRTATTTIKPSHPSHLMNTSHSHHFNQTNLQPQLITTTTTPNPPTLDRFAKPFIPRWLLNVSENASVTQINLPTKPRRLNPEESKAYIQSLLPRPFLLDLESETREHHLIIQSELATAFQSNSISWATFLNSSQPTSAPDSDPKAHHQNQTIPNLPNLSLNQYAIRFLPLIASEHSSRIQQLKSAQLYLVDIQLVDPQRAYFNLEAKSVREGWPPIELGDLIAIRLLYPQYLQSDGYEYEARVCAIKRVTGFITFECPQLIPVMSAGQVSLTCNVLYKPQDRCFYAQHYACEKIDQGLKRPPVWSLPTPISPQSAHHLHTSPINNVSAWLFPEPIHLQKIEKKNISLTESAKELELNWIDPDLNLDQKRAIKSFVEYNRIVPFLISGPPGTGKTKTITEAVFQILLTDPESHILVCGASNPSADTLALRLKTQLKPHELLRLNDSSRPFEEIKPQLLSYCYLVDGHFALPPLMQLLSKRVIVTSCTDASLLESSYCSNSSLQRFERFLNESIHPSSTKSINLPNTSGTDGKIHPRPKKLIRPHFTHLLIDEAAQATEPELAIPISVMISDHQADDLKEVPQILICGDIKQLGPKVVSELSRSLGLDLSLLQRLLERKAYTEILSLNEQQKKVQNRSRFLNTSLLSPSNSLSPNSSLPKQPLNGDESLLPHSSTNGIDLSTGYADGHQEQVPVVNLTKNYRSHPSILMLPSTLFYNDALEPYAPTEIQNTELLNWNRLPKKGCPMIFKNVSFAEDWVDEGSSWYNIGESEIVVGFVVDLMKQSYEGLSQFDGSIQTNGLKKYGERLMGLKASQVSIITPFREQVWVIRLALRKIGLSDVDVGTVESLQGGENRVVIVSTVRSHHKKHIEDDRRRDRGLIFEAQRFNVTLTRPKELLIVVGNAETLTVDPYWRSFYHFTRRMGVYEGPPVLGLEESVADVSVLEERFHRDSIEEKVDDQTIGLDGSGTESFDVDGRILVGSVARLALEDSG